MIQRLSAESASGFTPDPAAVSITSGGSVNVSYISSCRGYATQAPDVELQWSGGGSLLRFVFLASDSSVDTTLIINGPDGQWYCNDDTFGRNPAMDFSPPQSGVYDIWIGSYASGQNTTGTLYISEAPITP